MNDIIEYWETMAYEWMFGHDDTHVRDLWMHWLLQSELAMAYKEID